MDASGEDGECPSVMFEAVDYCQIVSRTRSPRFSPEGYPLLLNIFTATEVPETVGRVVRQALELPMPRSSAPRHPDESDGWAAVGNALAPPMHWLPQLADPDHGRKSLRKEHKPQKRGRS
jgi:hypothetical protein